MLRTVSTKRGELEYTLTQKKVKNMNLRVRPEGTVAVSASPSVPVKRVDEFVISKADFIFDALEKFTATNTLPPQGQTMETGDRFYLLGEALQLRLEEGPPIPVTKRGEELWLSLPNPQKKEAVAKALNQYFSQILEDVFRERMDHYQMVFAALGIPQTTLKVRSMKSRWGSCHTQKAVITLNSKLIHVPYECLDYVVLHEFCHLIHANHSKDFYHLVASYMPDWKPRREAMKPWGQIL